MEKTSETKLVKFVKKNVNAISLIDGNLMEDIVNKCLFYSKELCLDINFEDMKKIVHSWTIRHISK